MAKRSTERPRLIMVVGQSKRLEHVASWGEEMMQHYAQGAEVEVQVFQRRSAGRHRLYWLMIHDIVENSDNWTSDEDFHNATKVELGYVRTVPLINGGTIIFPGSISFEKMDEAEFKIYFDRAKAVWSKAGYDVAKFEKEASEKLKPYYGGNYGRRPTPQGGDRGIKKEAA